MPRFIADSIIVAPAASAHPDAALIDLCDHFIFAYERWETLNGSEEEEGDGPECQVQMAECDRLIDEIEKHQASTVDGILAQFRAYARAIRHDHRDLGPDTSLLYAAIRSLEAVDRARS